MSDGFLFNDGVVKVGNGILWVAGTTYPIRSINSIRATATDNKLVRWCGLGIVAFSVFRTGELISNKQMNGDYLAIGICAIVVGILMFLSVKDKYKLFINTIGGERQVLESKDKDYVRQVRAHVEECIAFEANPRGSAVERPMRTIDGTVRRDDGYLPRA